MAASTCFIRKLKTTYKRKKAITAGVNAYKNQLHAEQTKAITSLSSIKRMKARSKLIEKQMAEVQTEINDLVNQDASIKERIDKVCTLPSVGLQTAVTVVAETNGFNLIRNSRQLVSYAGLDIYECPLG